MKCAHCGAVGEHGTERQVDVVEIKVNNVVVLYSERLCRQCRRRKFAQWLT